MTMALVQPTIGRLSGLFWRKPSLGLFLLLLGPLMWFGIVYLGSLLTLLWQSFYTFDDFTMSVTTDLTLANLKALFNPANYDIIIRTLVMAICVTIASAILALPMAWYMARYTRGKMKAFFYIAVMLPMWASYIVKAYALDAIAGERWRGAMVSRPSWPGERVKYGIDHPGGRRQYLIDLGAWAIHGICLYLAAVHDPAGAGGTGTPAAIAVAGLRRFRRPPATNLPLRGIAFSHTGHRGRFYLYVFPHPWRFYCPATGGTTRFLYRQHGLFAAGRDWQYADGGGIHIGTDCTDCTLSGVCEAHGSV